MSRPGLWGDTPRAYVCPRCGFKSYNPNDRRERYCIRCHQFEDDGGVSVGYWMNETSGVLRPAVEAYLRGDPLDDGQIAALRAYFRQWIAGPWGESPGIEKLRDGIDGLTSRRAIVRWLDLAMEENIDPL
jgi:hypothetical protein